MLYDIDLPCLRLVVLLQGRHFGNRHALVRRFLLDCDGQGGSIGMVLIDLDDDDFERDDDHALVEVVIDVEPSILPEAYVLPTSVVGSNEDNSDASDLGRGFGSSEVLVVEGTVVAAGADVAASEPDTSEEPAAIHPGLVHTHDHNRGPGASSAVHIPQTQAQGP